MFVYIVFSKYWDCAFYFSQITNCNDSDRVGTQSVSNTPETNVWDLVKKRKKKKEINLKKNALVSDYCLDQEVSKLFL